MSTDTKTAAPPQTGQQQAPAGAQGMATRVHTPDIITTPAEYTAAIERWNAQRANILSPFTVFTGLLPNFGLIATKVNINPDPKGQEVYADVPWVPKGQVALAKVGLRKIAECAAMSTTLRRDDPYTIPNFWAVTAVARWRGLDGSIIERERMFEWDLRDGSPRTRGFTDRQILEARKHGLGHAQSRAVNGAIREYGVKQTYTLEEIAKPFVVLRVVYQPDQSDPEIRRAMADNFMRGTSLLYPGGAGSSPLALAPGLHEAESFGPTPAEAAPPTTPPPAATNDEKPPHDHAMKIMKVEERPFTIQNGARKGQQSVRYLVVGSDGVQYSTFSKTIYELAAKLHAEGAWVDLADQGDDYHTIEDLGKAQPVLPMEGNL